MLMSQGIVFDTSQHKLQKTLKDYQELSLRFVWEEQSGGAKSKEVYDFVNEKLGGGRTISRASIINFLASMAEEGVLDYEERSGKGGYHRVYFPKMDETGYRKHILREVIESMDRDFPEETKEVIREFI